jgi:cytochrome o ubiquinol oxidase subunit IV
VDLYFFYGVFEGFRVSNLSQKVGAKSMREQGSIKSYVTGFILSLILTFIPYYLVVNQIVSGAVLLATILGFAMLQMVVQITFFLHLGRGPKPNWNIVFFVATVGIILVVVGGSIMIMNNLHYNMGPSDQTKRLVDSEGIYQIGGEKTGACKELQVNYRITIKAGRVSPLHSVARKCDTLTFINEDSEVREITFGSHPEHGVYAGKTELVVKKGRSKSITLSELGTYKFHDHLNAEVAGEFSVVP